MVYDGLQRNVHQDQQQFQKLIRQMTTKRNLRNSNTCPSTQNPFIKDLEDPVKGYVPQNITRYIPNTSNITCNQITTLPIFNNQRSLDDALLFMKRASEWQSSQISQLKKGEKSASGELDHSEFREEGVDDEEGPPEEIKEGTEGLRITDSILDFDLQGFLMEPPRPIVDFEYPFNPNLIQPQSFQESSPFDLSNHDY